MAEQKGIFLAGVYRIGKEKIPIRVCRWFKGRGRLGRNWGGWYEEGMEIVHVSSELAEAAKAGGLADVVSGLAKAQLRAGHLVDIILPRYDCLQWDHLTKLEQLKGVLDLGMDQERLEVLAWRAQLGPLSLTLLDLKGAAHYFSRGVIYGERDDIDRFTAFSKAAVLYLTQKKRAPDLLHIHDWPCAAIAPLAKQARLKSAIVLTIHNLQHQGKGDLFHLRRLGLEAVAAKMQDPHSSHLINLLKGGIEYADAVTTVSPTYEKEIQTPLGGFGLDALLVQHKKKLSGILNGIDTAYWNPETDPLIQAHYPAFPHIDPKSFAKVLKGKMENRRALQKECGLAQEERPVVAAVTRMVFQKGPELILYAMERTVELGGQFILLSSLPEGHLQVQFDAARKTLPQNSVHICFSYREALAHLIYAGADMLTLPSLFEPCGLTQMIAMRYSSVPIVRKTGGLADTVFDVETSDHGAKERNGFTFDFPDRAGVHWALDRALKMWGENKKKWQQLMQSGAACDFSWDHSEPLYHELYKKVCKATRAPF